MEGKNGSVLEAVCTELGDRSNAAMTRIRTRKDRIKLKIGGMEN